MEDLKLNSNPSEFGSLTEIMKRFQEVPYVQFQKELNQWFEQNLKEKGFEMNDFNAIGIPNLSELTNLTNQIYHQAEVSTVLLASKIKTDDACN
jgi:maleate cis-trans isomerase